MYFNGYFAEKYYTSNYWKVSIELPDAVIHPSGVDLHEERRQEEEDIVLLMNTFLFMVNKDDRH